MRPRPHSQTLAHAASVDPDVFVAAMGTVCTSVTVVTTDGVGGRFGVTVSAMSAVSATPPQLLVCVNRDNFVADAVSANECFCVNVLGLQHREIAEIFAGRRRNEDRFACAAWERLATGCPVLTDALVAFDCVVERALDCATHRLFVGRVLAARANQGETLAYARRAFCGLQALPAAPSWDR